jgi:hypothetical protein
MGNLNQYKVDRHYNGSFAQFSTFLFNAYIYELKDFSSQKLDF